MKKSNGIDSRQYLLTLGLRDPMWIEDLNHLGTL